MLPLALTPSTRVCFIGMDDSSTISSGSSDSGYASIEDTPVDYEEFLALKEELGHDFAIPYHPSLVTCSPDVYDLEEFEGRQYHGYKRGRYHAPCDEVPSQLLQRKTKANTEQKERVRLERQHFLFLCIAFGALHLAPVGKTERVLDLGTGTGEWALAFADEHHDSEVIGIDLVPMQPTSIAPNCMFVVDDFTDTWESPFQFGFIHGRMIASSITDPEHFFEQCFQATSDGGWIELQDMGMPISPDGTLAGTALQKWSILYQEGLEKMGRRVKASELKAHLMAVGYSKVNDEVRYCPHNTWPEDRYQRSLGNLSQENMEDGLEALGLKPLLHLGLGIEEVRALTREAEADLCNTGIHCFWPM